MRCSKFFDSNSRMQNNAPDVSHQGHRSVKSQSRICNPAQYGRGFAIRKLIFNNNPPDICAQSIQALINTLVSPVDLINVLDYTFTLSG